MELTAADVEVRIMAQMKVKRRALKTISSKSKEDRGHHDLCDAQCAKVVITICRNRGGRDHEGGPDHKVGRDGEKLGLIRMLREESQKLQVSTTWRIITE